MDIGVESDGMGLGGKPPLSLSTVSPNSLDVLSYNSFVDAVDASEITFRPSCLDCRQRLNCEDDDDDDDAPPVPVVSASLIVLFYCNDFIPFLK